jgi:hypothetical protein
MRKLVLLAAAVPLVFGPAALAADQKPDEPRSVCRVPDVDLVYDTHDLMVLVSLPVDGCRSRQGRVFPLSASITRLDNSGGRDVADWGVDCGPFRSDENAADHGDPPSSCDLNVAYEHPEVESAQYDVEVTYPGATAERTMSAVVFCRSDGDWGSCEELAPSAERDVER